MKRFKSVIITIFVFVLTLCMTIPAFASESSVKYDGNSQEFIFEPGSDYAPTDLFNNFKGVMPGDSLTQKITIKNDASNKVKVKIYLRCLGPKEGSSEFLSNMNLTITADEGNDLFNAPANQTSTLTEWVCLGTFNSGANMDLNVKLDVSKEMGNEFKNAVGTTQWQFKVEEIPVNSGDHISPPTGNNISLLPCIGVSLFSFGICLLLLSSKKEKTVDE